MTNFKRVMRSNENSCVPTLLTLINKTIFVLFLSANNAEICQLAAIHGTEQFNVYILPLHGITPTAAAVNRLSVSRGRMFYEGTPVTAVQLDVAIQKFLNWLQSLTEPCLLLAHNAKLFDAKHLLKALEMSSRTEPFSEVVVGFCDTLPAFKELFPERKSYSQENLARDLLESTYNAHNALNDVQMLQELSDKFLSAQIVQKHSFSLSWYQEYTKYLSDKRVNLQTLQPLVAAKAISMGMAEKAAASGLSFTHLLLAFQRGGSEALSNVLKEKFNGKARVTRRKKVIMKICDFFKSRSEE